MRPQEIEVMITEALPGSRAQVEDMVGDGNHFQAIVIAEQFAGLTMIKQHQLVYSALQSHLDSGTLHALSLKTYTPEQWQNSAVQVQL
jgi:acid stress-induced BolA-like protein IbaG/YrbA